MNIIRVKIHSQSNLICPADDDVRAAMRRLNGAAYPFLLVVDRDGRLVGVLTDGDLRRAMLQNSFSFDSPVTSCTNQSPVTAKIDQESNVDALLRSTRGTIKFLPLLDDQGHPVAVLVGSDTQNAQRTALVMAGGFGKRLGELTKGRPKPLLDLGGKPILAHIIEGLEANGCNRIFLAVHHMADQFAKFATAHRGSSVIKLLHEPAPLGTAGAVSLLPKNLREPVLVINGDIVTSADYSSLWDLHQKHGNDATIGVARYEVEIPYGVIRHQEDGSFTGIDEKPKLQHFVAAGIYFLSPAFVNLAAPGETIDMPDLLNIGRSIGMKIGLCPIHEYWRDVGSPIDYQRAREALGYEY